MHTMQDKSRELTRKANNTLFCACNKGDKERERSWLLSDREVGWDMGCVERRLFSRMHLVSEWDNKHGGR